MKKKFISFWVFIFLLLNISTGICDESVQMGVAEWAPLISNDYKYNGVVTRIVTESFALEGIRVINKWAPWKRAYHNVETGIYDLSPGWTKTPEREKEVNFSDPIFETYQVFFHLKSFPFQWQSFKDLKGIRIGACLGYYYGEDFKVAEKNGLIKVEYVPRDKQNIMKLLKDRIQIFPLNILTGYDLIQKNTTQEEFSKIVHHPKKLAPPSSAHVVFTKNERNVRMMRLFNKGLKRLKETGKYDLYWQESRRGEYAKK